MKTLLLQAPRNFTIRIPKGYILQVVTTHSWNMPSTEEVREAMKRVGFTKKEDLVWACPSNWIIKELKF